MSGGLPPEAYVAALAGFERMTSARLRGLLARREPSEAFAIASGATAAPPPLDAIFRRWPELAETWRRDGDRHRPERVWERCAAGGIDVVLATDARFPPQLVDDPACPPALFVRGSLGVLDARRVGIVGTRNATRQGLAVAARFGHDLAADGVVVVSGLALGVDGAAHRGALAAEAAAPAAVVGNGLDIAYPKRNAELWGEVAARGVIVSEWPPGTSPDAFRFPLRNRILAALSEVLVVVESRERGGSLITAREAAERGITVCAVPGSVRSRASAGTNELLRDGATPALDPGDVFVALGLDHRRARRSRFDSRPRPRGDAAAVLDACRAEPLTVDDLSARLGMSLGATSMVLARLEHDGWLVDSGGWFEVVDAGVDPR